MTPDEYQSIRSQLTKDGWEEVTESGGKLWELHRGARWDHTITDVRVDPLKKTLWIKAAKASKP